LAIGLMLGPAIKINHFGDVAEVVNIHNLKIAKFGY
jgi:hypothetical protein